MTIIEQAAYLDRVQGKHSPAPSLLRQRHARRDVSIKELAEYLGHADPAFTLRACAHMLPCSRDRARAAISERCTRTTGQPCSTVSFLLLFAYWRRGTLGVTIGGDCKVGQRSWSRQDWRLRI